MAFYIYRPSKRALTSISRGLNFRCHCIDVKYKVIALTSVGGQMIIWYQKLSDVGEHTGHTGTALASTMVKKCCIDGCYSNYEESKAKMFYI